MYPSKEDVFWHQVAIVKAMPYWGVGFWAGLLVFAALGQLPDVSNRDAIVLGLAVVVPAYRQGRRLADQERERVESLRNRHG